jgi:hypothetical protein
VGADDIIGVIASPAGGLKCTEAGGTAVFALTLSSEPTSPVTVEVNASDTTEVRIGNLSAITFTKNTWFTPQTVTVIGVDDNVVDGNIAFSLVVGAATAADTHYHGFKGNDVGVTTSDGEFVFRLPPLCMFLS